MILRNRLIDCKADEISMQLSYSVPDVKRMLRDIISLYFWHNSDWFLVECMAEAYDEPTIIGLFECYPKGFAIFPSKWKTAMSRWAFSVAVREGYIIRSTADETKYYFTEKVIPKRIGRPRKEEAQ